MNLFISDAATVQIGTGFLRARCLATPFMFIAFHLVFSFTAMGEGKTALSLAVIRQLVLYIPLLFLMNRLFGMTGNVWTQAAADLGTVIVSYVIYARIRKHEGWPTGL